MRKWNFLFGAVLCVAAVAAHAGARIDNKEDLINSLARDGLSIGSTVWLMGVLRQHGLAPSVPAFTRIEVTDADIIYRFDTMGRPALATNEKEIVLFGRLTDGNDVKIVLEKYYLFTEGEHGDVKTKLSFVDPTKKLLKWGRRTLKAIADREVFIGMTQQQVLMSWGRPDRVNTSVGSWGSHEQWVFGDSPGASYLYFQNGRLASFQQ
jgi:hypothetical protein